ncbi:PEP/pyruvate-binding domain-containing protein [Robiginitalea sp. SC105]|uniref:PEP/pyruvate-binding domain-containing protein n=1 Tax=Robiginitalea sp. SC105 TaxID=2762332 RepID=UPI00163AEA14|nr:PEP/pyruvate-binding domain-containing protein [Robiginitalea sp. SC105]MBC2838553.1 phosphoenolpyruvate synthase [Robiginitalea sp. SC105]
MKLTRLPGLWALLFLLPATAQQLDNEAVRALVTSYKNDIRGPYRDIRWFCTDGSIRAPKDPCPEEIGPGVQHARYKESVLALAASNQVYLGQILAYSDREAFWDPEANHARLKQYQVEKYLKGIDDGWISRKGQYYRGAIQDEDEQAWGIGFYTWLLGRDEVVREEFFLVRQSMKDVPHSGDDNQAQAMRSHSKVLADAYPPFSDLRVKIHGQPEPADLAAVEKFRQEHRSRLTPEQLAEIDKLLQVMRKFYAPLDPSDIARGIPGVTHKPTREALENFAAAAGPQQPLETRLKSAAELLLLIRENLLEENSPQGRLQLLDTSLKLESFLFSYASQWDTPTVQALLEKICFLGMAGAGTGHLELWEWNELAPVLARFDQQNASLGDLMEQLQRARSAVEWSSSMVKAHYGPTAAVFAGFEPLSAGFIDDKVRGSLALHLGYAVGELGNFIARRSRLTNQVLDLSNPSTVRGLNPGFAFGELSVVSGNPEDVEVSPDKIYIFQHPPADLKPVAGIATVSEGNLVSHVQLLARNLGIPNAALSGPNLEELRKYDGQRIFYAVTGKGNVIMKPEARMTPAERALFDKQVRSTDRIAVPVDRIRLDVNQVLDMRSVDAEDSGALCGPKAANLGQLKKMFPDQVVEGLVIPFGVFRSHMEQPMPGAGQSYWEFLGAMFRQAETMRAGNIPEAEVENYQLRQLETLREAIRKMPLDEQFVDGLETGFRDILGGPLGSVPVFLRSDTNMEDLKDFTGAGLNLTLFNQVDKTAILDGIRAVWASPYTERSFKWRQRYLLNPENVYPSILVIPSVDVDYSGVLITKGVVSGDPEDLTVAFSRGAGGAVEGQAAESYLLGPDGKSVLLAPAREIAYNTLPVSGGTRRKFATFETPILNRSNLDAIRELTRMVRDRVPRETGTDYQGAYDIELGFRENKLWLFQIRPFVENKKALSSDYLESITPKTDPNQKIRLDQAPSL